ncbi:MAG: peptide deformylase [SAR324 cluster bacterium]|uniref:Peptide deformylase n=1 Tax=SAR324 cluster bacterium TaxID=2024889 RepID=A0A7X9FRG4_9DELT|nr:peptide deformylase [SAR324 cluster bacterium]
MSLKKIYVYPEEVLRGQSEAVAEIDGEIKTLSEDMLQTMYHGIGIGLAAPQIGVQKRVIVVDVSEDGKQPMVLINPEIIEKEGIVRSDEGCLSVPGFREIVNRNKQVLVRAVDIDGNPLEIEAEGLLSRCIQHEIDHLNGILFIDHLSRIKKEMFKRWVKKQKSELSE